MLTKGEYIIKDSGLIDGPASRKESLEVMLVHLPFYDYSYYQSPQLGLLYVASSLKAAGFNVGVLDDVDGEIWAESFVNLVSRHGPQILGFHVNTDSLPRVCRAIEILRKRKIEPPLIIFGGPHVSIEDQELLGKGFGSIVVRGEGEETIVQIARWWLRGEGNLHMIQGITYRTSDGEIVRNPDRKFISDLDRLPEPDKDLLVKQPQYNTFQILSGRGCPFHCAFCAEGLRSIHYRFRSPESVLHEIYNQIGDLPRAYLGVLDDTFLVNRRRVEKIANGLINRFGTDNRLIWFCEGHVDFINNNEDLFPLLKEAGLVRVQIGIESGSQEVLDLYGKEIQVEEIQTAVTILRDADIPSIFGNFIIGGAIETPVTIQQSIRLAKRLISLAPGRMEVSASMLALYPGTDISKNPSRYGLKVIDPQMLRCVSLRHPVAVTEKMGVNEILAAYSKFEQEVVMAYEEVIPSIPYQLIHKHLDFRSYGLITHWSKLFLRYPSVKTYYRMLGCEGYHSIYTIDINKILAMVPYRTVKLLEIEEGHLAVKAHPRKIIFNEMSAKIYELCSGKLTVEEIIKVLRQTIEVLPPEPYLTEQVIEVLREMGVRFLVIFSDL